MKENKERITETLKWVRLLAAAALAVGICIFLYSRIRNAGEPELTSSFINGKLESASELTTSELAYTGLIKYKEGDIPLLTQNSFSMIYSAQVRAGIDLSVAQIKISDQKVELTLPECKVQSIEIDTDSIEFYDERLALFNWTKKSDIIDAVAAAKEDVAKKADMDSLMEHAKQQTETLLTALLADAVGKRELVIRCE